MLQKCTRLKNKASYTKLHNSYSFQKSSSTDDLVSFSDPTTERVWGHRRRLLFCKLSNHVIICIDLHWRTCGHVMVHKTNKMLHCPQTLSLLMVGSGNVTTNDYVAKSNHIHFKANIAYGQVLVESIRQCSHCEQGVKPCS